MAPLPYYPDVPGAPQNTIIGGASLWVMNGRPAAEYKGVAKFFAYLSRPEVQADWHQATGYLPVTTAAYELTRKSGYYEKNPGADVAVIAMVVKTTTRSRGVRLGNLPQIRTIVDEELEAVWAGKKTAKEALDSAVARGNEQLERFQKTELIRTRWKKGSSSTSAGCPCSCCCPSCLITVVFFFVPAAVALYQSLFRQDAFGLTVEFAGLDNFRALFADPSYLASFRTTAVFSAGVTVLGLAVALVLAWFADRLIRGATTVRTLIVWPYAIAPAIAGVLWMFLFNPSLGLLSHWLKLLGVQWDYLLNGAQALALVTFIAAWKQISYNFLFFLAGLQSIPRALLEAAAIDGARSWKRFWTIVFPLLTPTTFFLLVINLVYAFFDTFPIIDAVTQGGPAKSTEILVYKVYNDGFRGLDIGGSAAQSMILMAVVVLLTIFQFRHLERRVTY